MPESDNLISRFKQIAARIKQNVPHLDPLPGADKPLGILAIGTLACVAGITLGYNAARERNNTAKIAQADCALDFIVRSMKCPAATLKDCRSAILEDMERSCKAPKP